MARQRKIRNENPVPRTNLPHLELYLALEEERIAKICRDLKIHWYRQIHIHEIEAEIRQTVLLVYCKEFQDYSNGIIDQWPPNPGFVYVTAKFMLREQWAPSDDLLCGMRIEFYNTMESGWEGGVIDRLTHPFVATRDGNVPFNTHGDEKDTPYGRKPDMVDFWYLGFSVRELAVIFNLHSDTIRNRLHNLYDALEAVGEKPLRPRPYRRSRPWNRFKTKEYRSKVAPR